MRSLCARRATNKDVAAVLAEPGGASIHPLFCRRSRLLNNLTGGPYELHHSGRPTVLLGLAGVGASARLYLVPGRPAWNSLITLLEFFATVAMVAFAVANVVNNHSSAASLLYAAAAALSIAAVKMARLALSPRYELYASRQRSRLSRRTS
jgi:hypothetical protein